MYRGELRSISPEVEGSRVKGVVAFTVDLPAGLKQNQRVSTRLILETKQNVLKVDRGPFVESGGGRLAYVIEDGMAVVRPIEVGSLSVSEAQIVAGLEVGDRIIISDTARFRGCQEGALTPIGRGKNGSSSCKRRTKHDSNDQLAQDLPHRACRNPCAE